VPLNQFEIGDFHIDPAFEFDSEDYHLRVGLYAFLNTKTQNTKTQKYQNTT
jgi:hypothetical protein